MHYQFALEKPALKMGKWDPYNYKLGYFVAWNSWGDKDFKIHNKILVRIRPYTSWFITDLQPLKCYAISRVHTLNLNSTGTI